MDKRTKGYSTGNVIAWPLALPREHTLSETQQRDLLRFAYAPERLPRPGRHGGPPR